MTNEFRIDDIKLNKLSEVFFIDKNTVDSLHKLYRNFSPNLKNQEERYLAHIIRGFEYYFRKLLRNEKFIIICEPFSDIDPTSQIMRASSMYYPPMALIRSNSRQGGSIIINYDSKLPEKELVANIAHEIGHWFLHFAIENRQIKPNPSIIESLASILGLFILAENDDFYANYDVAEVNHKNWDELLDCFANIQKEHEKNI